MQHPSSLPEPHRVFIDRAVSSLASDPRIVGVAAAGSYADDCMDEFSDIDLVIAVDPEAYAAFVDDRQRIAESLGSLLVGFTGEHVGEPRLLVCLYGSPTLHVDLKFVKVEDAGNRVDDPVVLWERDGALTRVLSESRAHYPSPDPQWVEDRFWVWVHYAATKLGRGELLETGEFLSYMRTTVLGPLGLAQLGLRPARLRRVEQVAPELAAALARTCATLEPHSLLDGMDATIELYRRLREGAGDVIARTAAEDAAVDYLGEVRGRLIFP
jgi:predicted nucleotidyltransferase